MATTGRARRVGYAARARSTGGNTRRRSPLTRTRNRRRNTVGGRRRMSTRQFAIPESRRYRIDDAAHARNALARVSQHGSPSEQRRVRAAVRRRYPSIGRSSGSSTRSRTRRRSQRRSRTRRRTRR